MKVDAQIEEECQRNIFYLQGYQLPKALLQETEYTESETCSEYSS